LSLDVNDAADGTPRVEKLGALSILIENKGKERQDPYRNASGACNGGVGRCGQVWEAVNSHWKSHLKNTPSSPPEATAELIPPPNTQNKGPRRI